MIFRGLQILEDKRAICPYPETSKFVDIVADNGPFSTAAEIGTGGGLLAMSLINENICDFVVATDISKLALEQARDNIENNAITNIELRQGDCWSPFKENETFDLVISNPPYLKTEDAIFEEAMVLGKYPVVAFDGGEDGMSVIRKIIIGAKRRLNSNGRLIISMGVGQLDILRPMISFYGGNIIFVHKCPRFDIDRYVVLDFNS